MFCKFCNVNLFLVRIYIACAVCITSILRFRSLLHNLGKFTIQFLVSIESYKSNIKYYNFRYIKIQLET